MTEVVGTTAVTGFDSVFHNTEHTVLLLLHFWIGNTLAPPVIGESCSEVSWEIKLSQLICLLSGVVLMLLHTAAFSF